MIATMHVPFVDLKAQHRALAPEIEAAVRGVFERGDFILGPAVEQFEAEYAALIGSRHAISVGSGLAAIGGHRRTPGGTEQAAQQQQLRHDSAHGE